MTHNTADTSIDHGICYHSAERCACFKGAPRVQLAWEPVHLVRSARPRLVRIVLGLLRSAVSSHTPNKSRPIGKSSSVKRSLYQVLNGAMAVKRCLSQGAAGPGSLLCGAKAKIPPDQRFELWTFRWSLVPSTIEETCKSLTLYRLS
jgi:hypothetical protein